MSTTRPRHSVLNLFDPLVSSGSLERDVPDADSDKENSIPPQVDCSLTTAFFGHSYKPFQNPLPVTKRRLVDIGDITLDETSMHVMLTDEEELEELNDHENDTLTFLSAAATPSRSLDTITGPDTASASAPRTPLGELTFDHDLTPVARTKIYRRTALPSSSFIAPEILVSSPGPDSSITSVINAVNSSGTSFAQSGPTDINERLNLIVEDFDGGVDDVITSDIQAPHIIISSGPPADSLSKMNPDVPTDSLLADHSPTIVSEPFPPNTSSLQPHRLRPNPSKTSSHDPNRRSIDLYSSFQLQLQSADASFDLLNDKISFLASGSGMDSFMSAMEGDDSFDMGVEEANMEVALEKMRLEDEANQKEDRVSSSQSNNLLMEKPQTPAESVVAPPMSPALETKLGEKRRLQKRLSFGLASSVSPVTPPAAAPTKSLANKAPFSVTSPAQSPRVSVFSAPSPLVPPSTIPTSTPLPLARDTAVLPQAVPALRIVKRVTRFGHGTATSLKGVSLTEASVTPKAPSASGTAFRGPTVAEFSTGLQPVRPAPAASGSSRIPMVQTTSVLPPTNKFSMGPRRVPMVNSQTIIPNGRAAAGNSKGISTSMTGPRRVPIAPHLTIASASIMEPVAGGMTTVTGLQAPVKHSTGIITASGLPRPASRLPALKISETKNPRTANTVGGIGNGIAGLGKSMPTRRMMYGGQ